MNLEPPKQIIREDHYHYARNGANKIVWWFAAFSAAILLGICGVVVKKVYDMSERLTRLEVLLEVLVKRL